MQKSFMENFQDKLLIEMNSAKWLSATASTHAPNAWWVMSTIEGKQNFYTRLLVM